MKIIELQPIKETTDDFDRAEAAIIELLREEIYVPILKELGAPKKTLQNSTEDLKRAILSGRISFYRGAFNGTFSSAVSKELKALGAVWDRKQGAFKIPQPSLPSEIYQTIQVSESRLMQKLASIDRKLEKILPAEIADKLQVSKFFDRALWEVERDFQASIKNITVGPALTEDQSKRIADQWQNNMRIYIQDFTQKEIKKLRTEVLKSTMVGNRYETMISSIQKSYDVSLNKAKFLAKQETSLLMTTFKQTRYQSAGINYYKWRCVVGSPNHPVRPSHKALDGKVFNFDQPPITDDKGNRNNPGQDYNCRCFAIPIVRFHTP
jgi:SPP1 gp7 family putative phage head morphogenesis protein